MPQNIPPTHDPAPPLFMLLLGAAALGIVAQLAVNLALGLTQSKSKLAGLLLLSGIISGGATMLLVRLTSLDDYVAATIATLLGTTPPLLVLRAGLQAAAKRAGVSLGDLLGAAPEHQVGWLAEHSEAAPQERKPDEPRN